MTDNPARSLEGVRSPFYLLTYEMAGPAAWDAPRDPAWTLREIAEHVSGVCAYAEYAGNLR